jgi:hypothetical protein
MASIPQDLENIDIAPNEETSLDGAETKTEENPPDCITKGIFPRFISKRIERWQDNHFELMNKWNNMRRLCYKIVEHPRFELFIIVMILISSMTLVNLRLFAAIFGTFANVCVVVVVVVVLGYGG